MNQRQKLIQTQFLNNEEAILKRLRQVYGQSQKDINGKIADLQFSLGELQEKYDWLDDTDPEKAKVKSMIQSKIYQKQYQEALKGQVDTILDDLQRKAYTSISEYLDKSYEDGYIGTMFDLQGQGILLCFPIDQEAMVRAVQLDSKISKGLYTRMGEDVAMLKKHITAEVSRGISSGMSYEQVAQQIQFKMTGTYDTPGGALARAMTIARTEGHRIQVQSGMDACYKAKENGADIVKQWDSTMDKKTRDSHAKVDGEIRELDEVFSNGLMFPGDPKGGAAEVVNCRCALLQRARWAVNGSFAKMNNFTKQIEIFKGSEDYSEFKKAFFSKENRQYMNYIQLMEKKYKTKVFQKVLDLMNTSEYNHYLKLLNATPIYKNIELNQTIKITKKSHISNYGVVNREFINSKDFHDKFETITNHKVVNESLYQESMKMLEHRDGTNLEDLIVIDSRTGKIIESVLDSKEPGKVQIEKEQHKNIVEYDGELIMIHNHPNGSRPSIADIFTLKEKTVDAVISVGHDGCVYKISNLNPKSDIDKIWDEAYNEYKKVYNDDIIAKHHALDDIYDMGIFDVEIW